MIVSYVLSLFRRSRRFVWTPAVDLRDHAIRAALLPGTLS